MLSLIAVVSLCLASFMMAVSENCCQCMMSGIASLIAVCDFCYQNILSGTMLLYALSRIYVEMPALYVLNHSSRHCYIEN